MARRPNYGFEKRQKEIQRQKKKDEKAEKKRLRKEATPGGEDAEVGTGGDGEAAGGAPAEADLDGVESGRGG